MAIERSDSQTVGVYRIDSWALDSIKASMSLREIKTQLGSVPINAFNEDDYPKSPEELWGTPIPIAFGIVKGIQAFVIDQNAKRFKLVDHAVITFDGFFKEDGTDFTPDSADLSNGEFVYSAWDGEEQLFADITCEGENPVDCVKLLLTDPVRGADLPDADLDTTSTGNKGFGTDGARKEYIMSSDSRTGKDTYEFSIGLYVSSSRAIIRYIEEVLAASFGILYVNLDGIYQIKTWKPPISEGMEEITDGQTVKPIRTKIVATDTFTRVVAKFNQRHSTGDFQTEEHSDERVRQLRGFKQHTVLEQELVIANRFGGRYWAERSLGMRGVPRRILTVDVTQEYMLKEPGDYLRVKADRDGVDEVFEILAVTINPGSLSVKLKLIDVRGHDNQPGFWVGDSPSFPDRLGGATITQWDSTWTDEQKKWAAENVGFWGSDEGYIDKADDTTDSYRKSVWV